MFIVTPYENKITTNYEEIKIMEEIALDRDEQGEILPTIRNFYRFCGHGRLMALKCVECEKLLIPPRIICPKCYSSKFKWIQLSGKGKIHTFSYIHIAPKQFSSQAPYIIGIVKLEEGLTLSGRIMADKDTKIEIGMDLIVDFEDAPSVGWPQLPRYYFKLP
jgi:uncharacterized OB-fold protein